MPPRTLLLLRYPEIDRKASHNHFSRVSAKLRSQLGVRVTTIPLPDATAKTDVRVAHPATAERYHGGAHLVHYRGSMAVQEPKLNMVARKTAAIVAVLVPRMKRWGSNGRTASNSCLRSRCKCWPRWGESFERRQRREGAEQMTVRGSSITSTRFGAVDDFSRRRKRRLPVA